MTYCIDIQALLQNETYIDVFNFGTETVAALQVPEQLGESLKFLLWGVVIYSTKHLDGLEPMLPKQTRDEMPSHLYVAGWSVIHYEEIIGGEIEIAPWEPRFDLMRLNPLSLVVQASPVVLQSRKWPCRKTPMRPAFDLTCVLERPHSAMFLSLFTEGPIRLYFDPLDCITTKQLSANLLKYSYDDARIRQLDERSRQLGLD